MVTMDKNRFFSPFSFVGCLYSVNGVTQINSNSTNKNKRKRCTGCALCLRTSFNTHPHWQNGTMAENAIASKVNSFVAEYKNIRTFIRPIGVFSFCMQLFCIVMHYLWSLFAVPGMSYELQCLDMATVKEEEGDLLNQYNDTRRVREKQRHASVWTQVKCVTKLTCSTLNVAKTIRFVYYIYTSIVLLCALMMVMWYEVNTQLFIVQSNLYEVERKEKVWLIFQLKLPIKRRKKRRIKVAHEVIHWLTWDGDRERGKE